MRTMVTTLFSFLLILLVFSCQKTEIDSRIAHPDVTDWPNLFNNDLSNAVFPDSVWFVEDGVLTATEDQNIWTDKIYDNFILDLEFKNAEETNSGVIVYCSDRENWIPNSVEIQIADDYSEKWGSADPTWQCGAVFGHLPAKKRMVKKPGEWNHYTITCIDSMIYVVLNGEPIIEMDLKQWTSADTNPDGSAIPGWLSTPLATIPTKGYIGFQGKHGDAPIYFKNIKIKEIN